MLTWNLKTWKEPGKDVLAGVRCCQGAKFRNHNSILLCILHIRVTAQKTAAVGHLTIFDVETMHQGHAVKPVVESEEEEMKPNEQRKQPDKIE